MMWIPRSIAGRLIPGLVLAASLAAPAAAQNTGTISGTIIDNTGHIVPGHRSHRALRSGGRTNQPELRHGHRHREPDAAAARNPDVAAFRFLTLAVRGSRFAIRDSMIQGFRISDW